ncbi:MAG: fluoride efflux transporter CrcB [Blastochloris sp.]|nr:fluoride efflux transporter CrcB [Blastochloris sp.]
MLVLGASLGAATRYYATLWAAHSLSLDFPFGTLLVNLVGSFVLGGFLTLAHAWPGIGSELRLLVATGFCGSLTTFSTFGYEVVELLLAGRYATGLLYALGSLLLGLVAVMLGIGLVRALLT